MNDISEIVTAIIRTSSKIGKASVLELVSRSATVVLFAGNVTKYYLDINISCKNIKFINKNCNMTNK